MKHHAHVAHHVPGRLRIRIPAAKGNSELLEQMKHLFTGVPGIDEVITRTHSGSILLHYDPRMESEMEGRFREHSHEHISVKDERIGDEIGALARQIEAEGKFLASHSAWAKLAVDFFKGIDREVRLVTNNAVDLKIILAVSLAAVTFVAVGAHAATPMWVTLALFALNHFVELHPPHVIAQTQAKSA